MQESHRNSVTLVLGGVRSGKSSFALQIALSAASVTFVATARVSDDEMRRKIERHRGERPSHWRTLEVPVNLAGAIAAEEDATELLVIDCLTLFVANLMEAYGDDIDAISAAMDVLCSALRKTKCRIVLVSNEVGSGIVPAYAAGRQFRDLLGELNQRVAAVADAVVLMIAGLPLPVKGRIEGLQ
ncbi:MAG TPA: bifunctional adenosylcobinamide kinase/adenosylcobinamide-phosphate guanylyltransferase [Acidisarcina sp.]|nr:bifunctional adenosylcobinamide kinase/adenosylcobinamide-phosphate guanylyltransferase [Acidisarcina sp.]